MNAALELHDSKIGRISNAGASVRIELPMAYVHRSAGNPGVDPGQVFVQPAEIVFADAQYSETQGPCSGSISDAAFSVNGEALSLLPIPLTAKGEVSATFTLVSGAVLSVRGKGVSCLVSGDPEFVEDYDG